MTRARSAFASTPAGRDILVFGALLAYLLLAILFPILRADRYCNDDLLRALSGSYGWSDNGRHLTNLLMRMLQLGASRLVDISPLAQLLAIAVLAWTGVLVARRFDIHSPAVAVMATAALGAQPFMLENLSYRFDALFMALAIMCSALPVTIDRHGWKGWAVGTSSLLAALNLYQPAIDVFLVFSVLEVSRDVPEAGGISRRFQTFVVRISQFAVASVAYRLLFAASLKDWVKDHAALASVADLPCTLAENARMFTRFVVDAFDQRCGALFVASVAAAIAVPMLIGARRGIAYRHDRPMWQTLVFVAALGALPFAALVGIVGPMLLLEKPVLMPRVMIGFGAFLCAALIAMNDALRTRPAMLRAQYVIGGTWLLMFAVMASNYGNASKAQDLYEIQIAHDIGNDLAELRAHHVVSNLVLTGSAGLAPVAERAERQFPLLQQLILPYLGENEFLSRNFLKLHVPGLSKWAGAAPSATDEKQPAGDACSMPALYVRDAYSLKLVGEIAVVAFAGELAEHCPASPPHAS